MTPILADIQLPTTIVGWAIWIVLLADIRLPTTIEGWGIWIVLAVSVAGIVLLILRFNEITIPPLLVKIGWIVLAAIVAIAAIKIVASI